MGQQALNGAPWRAPERSGLGFDSREESGGIDTRPPSHSLAVCLSTSVDFDPRFCREPAQDYFHDQMDLAYGTLLEMAETEALVKRIPQDGSWRFKVWAEEWREHHEQRITLKGQWVRTSPS